MPNPMPHSGMTLSSPPARPEPAAPAPAVPTGAAVSKAPSGKQFALACGNQRAVVTEVGAGLRRYVVDGVEVLDGFPADQMCTGARGQTFIPWPGRIAGGRYTFAGTEHQLPLTEPAGGNAIHGLTRWATWHLVHDNAVSLRLAHRLPPQPGYPFALRCELTYHLGAGGLTVETRVTNMGPSPCPFATGAQPCLRLGAERVDELEVQLPAATWYPVDGRGIPAGRRPVEGTARDLRRRQPIGPREFDTAYTDLDRGPDGTARILVQGPAGRQVEVWLDGAYGHVSLVTGDSLAEPDQRGALGVAPMTAAPDAFRSGDGLRTLAPGETCASTWGLRPLFG